MGHPSSYLCSDNLIVELKNYKVMAGLFFLFIVVVLFAEMLDGYLKSQDNADDSDTSAVIVFTPDDDAHEWEDARKK